MNNGPYFLMMFGAALLLFSGGMRLQDYLGEQDYAKQCDNKGYLILDNKVYTCVKEVG